MCGKVGLEVIQSPLREWEGAGRIGRGRGWGSGCKFLGAQRPQSISKPPPGVGGGRPNRPGAGVGIGILAERCSRVFKPPPGVGGGRPNRPGAGVGIGIVAERCSRVYKPPPGVGGGRPNRPGEGVGTGPWVLHVCRTKASATRPPCGGSGADAERRGTIIIL